MMLQYCMNLYGHANKARCWDVHENMLEDFLGNTSVFYDENSTKVKNGQSFWESLNLGALALFLRKKSYMQTGAESSNGRPTGVTNWLFLVAELNR